ncbi:hypothetical protein Tco_0636258 [Tanacetum coccineum]
MIKLGAHSKSSQSLIIYPMRIRGIAKVALRWGRVESYGFCWFAGVKGRTLGNWQTKLPYVIFVNCINSSCGDGRFSDLAGLPLHSYMWLCKVSPMRTNEG